VGMSIRVHPVAISNILILEETKMELIQLSTRAYGEEQVYGPSNPFCNQFGRDVAAFKYYRLYPRCMIHSYVLNAPTAHLGKGYKQYHLTTDNRSA
jgi:hypothetical protein